MLYVGLDIGFGETKVAVVGERELMDSFPSLIAEHTPSPLEEGRVKVSFGGKTYVVGRDARTEPGCFQLYDLKDLIRYTPLVTRYVFSAFNLEKDAALCVSCPPSGWPQREKLLADLRDLYPGTVVLPQGYGAFYTTEAELPFPPDTVLVLDFGYNTVDWLFIEKRHGEWKTTRGDTLVRVGVMKLVEYFRSELEGNLAELPVRILREFLKQGKGMIYGEELDFSGQKRRAEGKYREMLLQALKGAVGEIWREVDMVVCAGGGVYYFNPQETLPHKLVVIPRSPEFANALGQAKWLKDNLKEQPAG